MKTTFIHWLHFRAGKGNHRERMTIAFLYRYRKEWKRADGRRYLSFIRKPSPLHPAQYRVICPWGVLANEQIWMIRTHWKRLNAYQMGQRAKI